MKYLKNFGYFIITLIIFAALVGVVCAVSALWAASGAIIFVVMVVIIIFLLVKEGCEYIFRSRQ